MSRKDTLVCNSGMCPISSLHPALPIVMYKQTKAKSSFQLMLNSSGRKQLLRTDLNQWGSPLETMGISASQVTHQAQ